MHTQSFPVDIPMTHAYTAYQRFDGMVVGTLYPLVEVASLISAIGMIVVTLLQVTKAETGGGDSMGFGTLGGRSSTNVAVGAERILRPLTLWFGTTFVFTAALLAVPKDRFTTIAAILVPIFIVIMMFRQLLSSKIKDAFPDLFGHD